MGRLQRTVLMLLRWCLLIICGLLAVRPSKAEKDKLWEKDMSQEVYIEASVEGLKGLHLQCFKDKMKVTVELADHVEDYDGVVYTRGSYSMGKRPCFYDAKGYVNEELSLEWSFDECKTAERKDGRIHENVVIVQQDDMLIYPVKLLLILILLFKRPLVWLIQILEQNDYQ